VRARDDEALGADLDEDAVAEGREACVVLDGPAEARPACVLLVVAVLVEGRTGLKGLDLVEGPAMVRSGGMICE
jgi:hypothetical protein